MRKDFKRYKKCATKGCNRVTPYVICYQCHTKCEYCGVYHVQVDL